ncbi:MAG: aspartate kinase [Saprospiraceae bacterium]|nr:aspartate kinase [Saprospiraceae bacterium]
MQVYKFGGTSLGTPERMKQVVSIITANPVSKIVVLSAVAGTTNELVGICNDLSEGIENVEERLDSLSLHYRTFINKLYHSAKQLNKAQQFINEKFDYLRSLKDPLTIQEEKNVLALGELISSQLFTWLLEDQKIHVVLLPALEFMRIDKSQEPDEYFIKSMLEKVLHGHSECKLFITQGYICRNAFGEIDNLKRGGSDYTATLVGQAIEAEEIQIWTDITGMHNNDPRIVERTYPVETLSYEEAAELAYFGAKILHPSCVQPAKKAAIPIRLKNTLDPSAAGTLISHKESETKITAVAAKDGISAIKIKSGRMLNAYGFLKKIFEIFEKYETPIDMITTSEVAVSLTIDDNSNLPRILSELRHYGQVEVDQNQTIICIVGDFGGNKAGTAIQIFGALQHVPIRMISYGGSDYNVSVLIHADDKHKALRDLNQALFHL